MNRPTEKAAIDFYARATLHELGAAAHEVCLAKHPEAYRTYVVDRNVNYTNVCATRCRFCAFSVDEGDARGYVLPEDSLLEKIDELVRAGGTQVLLQGGMHPSLPFDFYTGMLRRIRSAFPSVQIHAFSPPEIWFFHEHFGMSVECIIGRLVEAGLSSIPGGGAEVLSERPRAIASPKKCTAAQWLMVMEQAHAMGLRTTATMMFGHVETPAERIEHLLAIRELQDRSLSRGKGHFTAFICWTFQPPKLGTLPSFLPSGTSRRTPKLEDSLEGATQQSRVEERGAKSEERRESGKEQGAMLPSSEACPDSSPLGSVDYLRTLAVSRLVLDNFANLQASWVTQGPKVGQLALFYGANDMGGVMMEENVVAAAGTSYRMDIPEIRRLIQDAGWEPRQRDGFYNLI